jgi:hypothetical protein
MDDKLIIQEDGNLEKGALMPNYDQDLATLVAPKTPQLNSLSPRASGPEGGLAASRFLETLSPAIVFWLCCTHEGGRQMIIRFQNGYGAVISEHRRLAWTYEVAPLRFHGPSPDDYEFYFRSHVPDLTWCSGEEEIVSLCEEISRLTSPESRLKELDR